MCALTSGRNKQVEASWSHPCLRLLNAGLPLQCGGAFLAHEVLRRATLTSVLAEWPALLQATAASPTNTDHGPGLHRYRGRDALEYGLLLIATCFDRSMSVQKAFDRLDE
jgi:hypothetical protein